MGRPQLTFEKGKILDFNLSIVVDPLQLVRGEGGYFFVALWATVVTFAVPFVVPVDVAMSVLI